MKHGTDIEAIRLMPRSQLEEVAEKFYRLGLQVKEGWHPFICGTQGDPGQDGLHDAYTVCPCPGADVVAVYRRDNGEDNERA